jgi:zinc protease
MRFPIPMLPAQPILVAAALILPILPILALLGPHASAAPPSPSPSPPSPSKPPAPAGPAGAPAAPAPAPAATLPKGAGSAAFPFPVHEKTLANGLKIYVVGFDSPGLVAYYSVVRTGSRNEVEPGKSGFAHFFEHLMFRGSQAYSAEKYTGVIKEMGADSNAFTSDDLTVYHILAGKAALPKIVEIEADRFQHLQYEDAKFQKEARAVLGEYNKNASNPIEKMVETLYENAFTTHTYKHTTMGFLKDIENMPKELAYSRQFFDRYYRPENVIILVVGDADPETVFKLVEKHYGDWKRGGKHPAVPVEPPQKQEKRAALAWKGPTLPMLLEGYHAPAFSTTNVDVPTLDVLSELLFAERAPLYQRLVIKEQKVETLSGSNDAHIDPNLFTVLARIKKPADIAYVEKAIHEEMVRIAREGVDEKTLADVLSHVKYGFAGQLSTADKTAYTASSFLALTGDIGSINAYFALYDKVTSADVKRVAGNIFRAANRTVVTMKAEKP